jgi:Putative porin
MESKSSIWEYISRGAGLPATPVIRIGFSVLFFTFCGLGVSSFAQQPDSLPLKQPTEPLLITYAYAPERSSPSADTLPNTDFRMYDPARQNIIDWGNLGNLGTATRPLLFENPALRGFDVGMHSFDLYKLRPVGLGFYRNINTFSDVSFSQGRTQFETNLTARFARTFSDGVNFSLEYRTLNNLGQYRYQRNKKNSLNVGLWLPLGKRYDGFLIYTRNVTNQQENGGIVTDTIFGDGNFSGPIAAEIQLPREVAHTRFDEQILHYSQHLRLVGKDIAGKRALRASHTIAWNHQTYKFSDQGSGVDGLGADADFFAPTFLVDIRGIRHFVRVNRIDNTITLNTFKTKDRGKPSDLLAFGLAHSYFIVNQEPREFKVSNLFLTGNLSLTPSDKFAFNAQGALGVLGNIGEYQLQGELTLGLGAAGQLQAKLLSQIRPPALLLDQFFVSKRQIWNNDFAKPMENSLTATYALPRIGFEASARAHVVNNYLYFDQGGLAAQTSTPLQVTQLLLRENLTWRSIHFDNTVALQKANRDDVLHLPTWFSKNSLYYSGKVFNKRMLLNVGVDFRINSEFRPDAYQPLSGQFYLQDSLTQQPYPWIDLFVAFKVQSFMGFVRWENGATLWDKTQVFYQTAYHPLPFGALRLGITWRFMDSNLKDEKDPSNKPGGTGSNPSSRPIGPRG